MYPTIVNTPSRINSGELLINLYTNGNFIDLPTNYNWIENKIGSGETGQQPGFLFTSCGGTPYSSGSLYTGVFGLSNITSKSCIDWDKQLHVSFTCTLWGTDTQVIARTQLKNSSLEGALSQKGIGIRIDNHTMYAESYGTTLAATSMGVIRDNIFTRVDILHVPGKRIEYWVDHKLKVMHTATNNIPSGESNGVNAAFVHSIKNGAAGGAFAYYYLSQPKIWQER